MKLLSTAITTLGLVAMLAPAPAHAQSPYFDLHPELTKAEFEDFAAELGSVLRFRQLGDTTPLGKGKVDVGVQFANAPVDEAKAAWKHTISQPGADRYQGESVSFPRIVGRIGVSDRVDIGAWGGFNPNSNYGLVGVDTKIALLRQDTSRPVSVSIRPSVTSLVGPSEVWVGAASLDISVSRAVGPLSPYVGVATTATLAMERATDVDLDPVTAEGSLAYAGLMYRWRALIAAAEVEKGTHVSYGFRIGTRF